MLTPPPSPPTSLSQPSAGGRLARCTTPSAHSSPPPVPSPLLPSSGCPTQIQTLRIASTQALVDAVTATLPSPLLPPLPPSLYIPLPVDHRDDIPESEQPPRKSIVDAKERRRGISKVGYGIRDTWVDPAEAVPEIAPTTLGEVSTRVAELTELHEHDTKDLYALLEDAQDGDNIDYKGGGTSGITTAAEYSHSDTTPETLRVMRDMRREMSNMQAELLAHLEHQGRARKPGPDARIPNLQDASGDADSHV
ncbi:hypothetical protein Tco_0154839 [Tanacetum coccineum]